MVAGNGLRRWHGLRRYGCLGGLPVIYHHGWPGSAREASLVADAAKALGLDVVAWDRPGYGATPPIREAGLRPVVARVEALADALGWARFTQVGVSGGAPFAMACATLLPQRVLATTLVGGISPFTAATLGGMPIQLRLGLRLARVLPRAAPFCLRGIATPMIRANPLLMLRLLTMTMAAPDQQALAEPGMLQLFASIAADAFAWSAAGPISDLLAFAGTWDVDVSSARQPLWIFHGDQDHTVGVACARHWARLLPQAKLSIVAGEGHFSLPSRHGRAILSPMRDALAAESGLRRG